MTAYTSSGNGNWSASATWGGAGVPGIGDTASIGHDITVDVDTTVGTSGVLGTSDVTFTAAKTLTIADGKFFKCRSDLSLVGPVGGTAVGLVLGAGSQYYFDGSVSNVSYKIKMGSAANQAVRITANGTAGSRAGFTTLGTAAGAFTQGGGVAGQCDFNYTNFVNVASSTFNANVGTTPTMNLIHCDLDANCGTFNLSNMGATATCRVEFSTFRKTSGTGINYTAGFTAGATLTCKNNVFVGCNMSYLNFSNGPTFVENNLFGGASGLNHAGAATISSTVVRNNAFMRSGVADMGQACDFTGNYYGWTASAAANPHGVQFTVPGGGTQNITGNIFEYGNTATDGDMITPGSPASLVTVNVKNNLYLPNGAGNSSGTLISFLGSANMNVTVDHNTAYVSATDTGGVEVGETFAGAAGMIASIRSNLFWRSSTAAATIISKFGAAVVTANTVTVHGYSGRYNLTGARDELTAGAIATDAGGHVDVSTDPFVDSSRNIRKWDQSLGGAGTAANAWTELCKANDDAGFNPSYTPAALYAYITDGFKVTDTTLQNAGHDGVTIGAFAFQGGTASATGGRSRKSVPIIYHLVTGWRRALSWVTDLLSPSRPAYE